MPKPQALAETAQDAVQHKTPAPYLPFRTFQSAIESLEHGIPKKLDRTMWPSQSGLVQSQILMAFRFLGLVDQEDHPTEFLHSLVSVKENRPDTMQIVLMTSYSNVVEHDLTKMTPKMIEDEMDRYHVSGETKRKAVTFFLRAAKFAGMPMHPLLSSMVRNTGPRKRRSKVPTLPKMNDVDSGSSPLQSPAAHATTVHLSKGAVVTMTIAGDPFTLPQDERTFVFGLVDAIQAWTAAHPSDEESEEPEE